MKNLTITLISLISLLIAILLSPSTHLLSAASMEPHTEPKYGSDWRVIRVWFACCQKEANIRTKRQLWDTKPEIPVRILSTFCGKWAFSQEEAGWGHEATFCGIIRTKFSKRGKYCQKSQVIKQPKEKPLEKEVKLKPLCLEADDSMQRRELEEHSGRKKSNRQVQGKPFLMPPEG